MSRSENAVDQQPTRELTFRGLYEEHRHPVWSYCYRRLPRDEVADAVEEVFLVAWRRLDDVPQGAAAGPWLFGVARNVIRNADRSRRRRSRVEAKLQTAGVRVEESAESVAVREAEDVALLAAVGRLRPIERELLRLRTWEELPLADIGDVVGMSTRSVESRLARVRKKLARAMNDPDVGARDATPSTARKGDAR